MDTYGKSDENDGFKCAINRTKPELYRAVVSLIKMIGHRNGLKYYRPILPFMESI